VKALKADEMQYKITKTWEYSTNFVKLDVEQVRE
jgi:DNA-directed RNA polymerase subunit F